MAYFLKKDSPKTGEAHAAFGADFLTFCQRAVFFALILGGKPFVFPQNGKPLLKRLFQPEIRGEFHDSFGAAPAPNRSVGKEARGRRHPKLPKASGTLKSE